MAGQWRKCGGVESSAVIDKNATIYFGTMGADFLFMLSILMVLKMEIQRDGLIWSTPAIAEDGNLYFTTWGGFGNLHAVTQMGHNDGCNDGYDSVSTSSPAIGEDVLYILVAIIIKYMR